MQKKKVLGTEFFPSTSFLKEMESMGHPENHRQVRIVCLCTGIKDANRICEKYGLGDRVFVAKYVCESANIEVLEVLKKTELAVRIDENNNLYIPVQQLVEQRWNNGQ